MAFMRAEILGDNHWWPDTLVYVDGHGAAFEVFARSASKQSFDRARHLRARHLPALEPVARIAPEGQPLSPRTISFYRLSIRDGAFAGGEGRELGPLKPEGGPPDEKPERG